MPLRTRIWLLPAVLALVRGLVADLRRGGP
jgi:hypothetical protein